MHILWNTLGVSCTTPMVAYEYVADRKTLFDLIRSKNDVSKIPWNLWFKITFDVAQAMNFLHFKAFRPILHFDCHQIYF